MKESHSYIGILSKLFPIVSGEIVYFPVACREKKLCLYENGLESQVIPRKVVLLNFFTISFKC